MFKGGLSSALRGAAGEACTHLRGSVRCTYDQAENCSACLGARPAHQPAESKKSHSGLRMWKPGPTLVPTPRRMQMAQCRSSSGHPSSCFISPNCSHDYKTKLRFSYKPGSEGRPVGMWNSPRLRWPIQVSSQLLENSRG